MGHPLIGTLYAVSAEEYRQQQELEREQAVIEALGKHGELVLDVATGWWRAPDTGDGTGLGIAHGPIVVRRLARRGKVVVVRGTRVVVAP